jgi:hypothetical protein
MITRHFLLYFVSAQWQSKFISQFIAMGPPFAGAQSALMGALSGDPFGAPLPHDWFQPAVATMPATAYLLPVGSVVTGAIVSTRNANYTASDDSMQQLLHDAGLDTVAELFPSVSKLRYDGTAVTSVNVTCIIGISSPTPLTLHYDIDSFKAGHSAPPPAVGMGDGDGTVNR